MLEFHLPCFVLRRSRSPEPDTRPFVRAKTKFLRQHGKLPGLLSDPLDPSTVEFLYEIQISLLLTGWDEWCWTAHCWVDAYFGSVESIRTYDDNELDGPTGRDRDVPEWNPRGWFLLVLAYRFKKITKEWAAMVGTMDARLQAYVNQFSFINYLFQGIDQQTGG